MKTSTPVVTIIISYPIEFYLFSPVILGLVNNNKEIDIVCNSIVEKMIRLEFSSRLITFKDIDLIKTRFFFQRLFHKILLILFTPMNFSDQYKIIFDIQKKKINIWSFFYWLSYLMPKSKNINKRMTSIFSCFSWNFVNSKKILVPSLNPIAFLLNYKGHEIYTLMESWDHAMKLPNGYVSEKVFVWNNDLKNDWINFQKDNNVVGTYPLKLRYAHNNVVFNKSNNLKKNKVVVYAFASTKSFSTPKLSEVEHKILEKICLATHEVGYKLIIKPRPIGDSSEFDYYKKKYDNVSVAFMNDANSRNASNYFLSDDYNKLRFNEINNADFVINCFTTFGLDSAVTGKPVLQIDVSNDPDLSLSKMFYLNHHIKKYLLKSENILKVKKDLKLELIDFLNSKNNIHINYTKEINSWLFQDFEDIDKAIDVIINDFS